MEKNCIPLGSVLGALLFLIFINDLPDGITSICKMFADDTSLFSKIHDIDISAKELNSDLEKLVNRLLNGIYNLILNPINRQMKLCFSRKSNKCSHPPITFISKGINKYPLHKHLGIVLDSKLDSKFDVDQKNKKFNKLIDLIGRLSVCVPRKALLTIYNCSLDFILTMVIFYMINQKTKIFKTN